MTTPHILTAALLLSSPLAALSPQVVGGQWETPHQFDGASGVNFGLSVSDAGDVDGDGFDDVIVGASQANPGGLTWAGSAYVYSGANGALLWQFNGQAAYDFFGLSVSGAGDIDGDGFDDVIVGAWATSPGGIFRAGSAYIYSGANGALLWQFDGQAVENYFGQSVSDAGDVDGDGFDDVIVGAWAANPGGLSKAGSAYIYSGATGALLWQFDGQAADDRFGANLSGAGDVDGDGFDDVIVGANGANSGGLTGAGSAYVYSGATGALLWQFDGQAAYDAFGASVSGAGDVDGDGFDDVIVGAYFASPGGRASAGSAYAYSGATGLLLGQLNGQAAHDNFGKSVSGAGDVDGDGFDDVIVGALLTNPGGLHFVGSAYIYSFATGTLLRQFHGQAADHYFGQSVSGAGDVDGDGFDDVIVGAYGANSAYVYSLDPFLHMDSRELSASGSSTVQLSMDFPASEAGASYVLLASMTGTGPIVMGGLDIPLTQDHVFNNITSGNVPSVLQGAFGTLNANGQALASLSTGPALNRVIGQTIYFAAVTYDVGPLTGRKSSIVRYLQIVP
jgi:hypothetical protein